MTDERDELAEKDVNALALAWGCFAIVAIGGFLFLVWWIAGAVL